MTSYDQRSSMAQRHAHDNDRIQSPSSARNRGPILDVLKNELPPEGLVLELASGTGELAVHVASHLPGIFWQPSEPDPPCRRSIDGWRMEKGVTNMAAAIDLVTTDENWSAQALAALTRKPDAIVCNNMIHIVPWAACDGLIAGAGLLLDAGGLLFIYGPFSEQGVMVESNQAFDARLRERNPQWGVRALEQVSDLARRAGFRLDNTMPMPANNLSVCFRRL